MNPIKLKETFIKKFKIRHKLVNFAISLFTLLVIAITGTLAMPMINQGAFNPASDVEDPVFQLSLLKLEIDVDGVHTENPVPGAEFVLYVFDEETEEWQQVLLGGEPLFFTDENGEIVFNLLEGRYVIREHNFPNGFGPEIVEGEPVTSWYFVIRESEIPGQLELVIDEVVVSDNRIIVFNQRLSGDLEIEKVVVNEDGSELSEAQLAQPFEFVVTFLQDDDIVSDTFTFVIYEGEERFSENEYTVSSGDSIFLRHRHRAVFRNMPAGIEYRVVEVVPAGFSAVGSNAQGVIQDDEISDVRFENTYDGEPERTGDLLVGKEVRGEGADLEREFKFVVTLDGVRHEFMLKHGTTYMFENIPVGTPYTVYEYDYSEDGYWVNISIRTGYITNRTVEIWFVNRFIDPSCPDPSCPIYEGEGDLEISKTILSDEEIDEEQLFNFTLELSNFPEADEADDEADDEGISVYLNGEPYMIVVGEDGVYVFEFQLRHGERFKIEGLPHGVRYDVVEHATPGFVQEITSEIGMIFEGELSAVHFYNKVIPEGGVDELTSIRICKELENDDVNFPSETLFNFVLMIEGEEHARFQLRAGECRVFDELDVDAAFEVNEVSIPGRYTLVSSGTSTGNLDEDEIVVTFVNRDTMRDIPVVKAWNVGGGAAAVDLPEYIVIHLLDGDRIVEVAEVRSDGGNWEHLFVVPRYDRDGNVIVYRVVEVPIPGWQEAVSVTDGVVMITNTAVSPVTAEVEVVKRIEGEGQPGANKTFGFALMPVGGTPMPEDRVIFIENAGRDVFGFTFRHAGTFVYTIHEIIPENMGNFVYDTAVFQVTIVVAEVEGELVVVSKDILRDGVVATGVVFVNTYYEGGEPPGPPVEPPVPPRPPAQTPVPPRPPAQPPVVVPPSQSRPPQTGDPTDMASWITVSVLSGFALMLCGVRAYMVMKMKESE